MKIKVQKLEERAIIPEYQTKGSAGFDFHVIDTVSVQPGSTVLLRTGLAMEIPEGYELQIRPRSGLSYKTKLRLANSPGTIDSDYRGEIKIIIENTSKHITDAFTVKEGDRIAQGVLSKINQASFELVEDLQETERNSGGFGHTGD